MLDLNQVSKRFLWTLAALSVLSSTICRSTICQGAEGKRYALIVGVSTYRPGQPLTKLPYTENDANELAKVLTAGGYQVTLMTQAVGRTEGKEILAPMSDFIRDQLDAMLNNPNLRADDMVLVALAGHGVQYELIEGDKKSAKFYFCPTDADIAKITSANDITEQNRILDLAELYTSLNTCKAGGKLLLVDACRNDPSKPGVTRSTASVTLPPLPPPPGGTAAFFSCSAHQQAFEDKDLQHGVFFHHVIKGLKGDADTSTATRPADGQVTLAELSENVASTTYDYVRTKYNGAKQSPELKGEFRVTMPLIALKKVAANSTRSSLPMPGTPLPKSPASLADAAFEGKQAGEVREFNKALSLKLAWCVPDTFMMGTPGALDAEAQKSVTLTRGFWMGQSEVTQAQWKTVVETEPWKGQQYAPDGPAFPVTYVNHDDALAFCQKLTERDQSEKLIPMTWKYDLPTEAQWEYACRASTKFAYSFGESTSSAASYAWYQVNEPKEVRKKRPNPWNLYDMHGNVWEFCGDNFEPKLPGGKDPFVSTGGSDWVLRGGSWYNGIQVCRSAHRYRQPPDYKSHNVGFRVALVPATK